MKRSAPSNQKRRKELYLAEETDTDGPVIRRHVVDVQIDLRVKWITQLVLRIGQRYQM